MKVLVVLAAVVAIAYGQLPGCRTPPQWYGYVHESDYRVAEQGRVERVEVEHRHLAVNYDYTGQRIHLYEFIDETTPFPGPPGPPERDIRREELYLFREHIGYVVENSQCRKITIPDTAKFEPFGPPADAEHRGQTYIGGGASLAGQGVKTDVYSTPRTITSRHYHGNFSPAGTTYCIPVAESFFNSTTQRIPRPGAPQFAIHGHMTFYNITSGVNPSAFRIPTACTQRIL